MRTKRQYAVRDDTDEELDYDRALDYMNRTGRWPDEKLDHEDAQEYLARPHSQKAIAALVFAILGILSVTAGGFVFGIVAIVLSWLAIRDVRSGGVRGNATAQWALVIGVLATLGGAAALVNNFA